MRLLIPVLAAGLNGASAPGVNTAQRNLASRDFTIPAKVIAKAPMRELSRLQRRGAPVAQVPSAGAAPPGEHNPEAEPFSPRVGEHPLAP